jgi:hypothetical protein
MSNNILNDISKVYLQTVVESSHLETDMKKRREANEKAIKDMKKTAAYKSMAATAAKKFDEALDPVGREDDDVDNDGKKNAKSDKYLLKRRKAIGNAISTQEEKEVKRWWDDDGDGKGYEKGEVSGKFKKKKKAVKEGFSDWREDLKEIINVEKDSKTITGKNVNNNKKIVINPKLDLGESINNLGGQIIEVEEINEEYLYETVDVATEYFFNQGLNEDGLEIVIEELGLEKFTDFVFYVAEDYELTEARRSGRIEPVTKSGKSIGSLKGGAKASAIRAKQKEKAARDKTDDRPSGMTAALRSQSSVAKKVTTDKGKKAVEKAKSSQGSKKPVRDTIARGVFGAVKAFQSGMERHKKAMGMAKETGKTVAKAAAVTHEAGKRAGESKVGQAVKKGAAAAGRAVAKKVKSDIETTKKAFKKEELEINEKTLTAAETKKKEEIVKSMKKGISGFKSRYGDRAKEVMYATATKQAKKVAEAVADQSALSPQELQKQRQKATLDSQIAQMRKQSLLKTKNPTAEIAKEEFVDEARAEEKRGLGSTGAQRQRQKTKIGGIANPATSYSGGQNPQLRGKEGKSKEERRSASRRYVDQPGGIYAKPENKQGEGRYAAKQARKRPDLGSRFD